MAEVGFPYQSKDQRDSPKEQQHRLDKLRSARGQSDYLYQSAVKANFETDMEIDKGMTRKDEIWSMSRKKELEQWSPATELILI